jgi:hypothetical protein
MNNMIYNSPKNYFQGINSCLTLKSCILLQCILIYHPKVLNPPSILKKTFSIFSLHLVFFHLVGTRNSMGNNGINPYNTNSQGLC